MTSNIGSQYIVELGEEQRAEMERRVMEALRAHFKPEFLNRVDEVILFHQLGREHLDRIVEIQLERVQEAARGAADRARAHRRRRSACWPRRATTRTTARGR